MNSSPHDRAAAPPPGKRQASRTFQLLAIAFMSVLMAAKTDASSPPSLLVLPFDMIDTSGETPSHAEERDLRARALGSYLSNALTDRRIYTIINPAPIEAEIATAGSKQHLSECNGCELGLAKLVHADRVLVGRIDKISTLIGNLTLRISDARTGKVVFARTVSFRGDTDEAWQHAVRFLIRDLGESATPKP